MNNTLKFMFIGGRKVGIASNLMAASLNLLAYLATKDKKHLALTAGSAAIVLILTSKKFDEYERNIIDEIDNM